MPTTDHIDAVAELVGLRIEPEWRLGVERFLALAADMAAVLETVELDDGELIQAPVYAPPDTTGVDGD